MADDKFNPTAAATEIRNMARAFRAFADAENALGVLENLATVKGELERAIDKLRKELSGVESQAAKDAAAAVSAKDAATQALAAAEQRAAAIVAAAQADAERLSTQTAHEHAAARAAVAALTQQAGDLERKVAAATKRLAELQPLVDRADRIAAAAA